MGWGQTVDVSKLAWPLMEMASVLEKRDGPGIVKVGVKVVELELCKIYTFLLLELRSMLSNITVDFVNAFLLF